MVGFTVIVAELDLPPCVAVIVEVSASRTYGVVMVNEVFAAPAGTVTVPGTPNVVRLVVSVKVEPPAGAAPGRVIVPVLLVPPITSEGAIDSTNAPGTLIVRVADAEAPPRLAVMFAAVVVVTEPVETGKFAELDPAGTVTLAATVAALLLEVRDTVVPPVGATPVIVTVPVDEPPPNTDVGDRLTPSRPGALTVSVVVLVMLPWAADIVAVTEVETADVVTVKFAAVAPAAIVTLEGRTALALLEPRETTNPPVGAGFETATVPVADRPPTRLVGDPDPPTRPGASRVRTALREIPA